MLLSQNLDDKYEDRLRNGSLDFAIIARKSFDADFLTRSLMHIRPVIYMRKGHPLANLPRITLDQRLNYQHMAFVFS